jgi:hypothetical protein
MSIPDPDFYPFRIPDQKTATKERGAKKFVVKPFFVATNFTKLKIILFFKCWRKNFGPVFKELYNLYNFLAKNLPLRSKKYGVGIRDPGSGKKTYYGSRIPDPDPQHRIKDVQATEEAFTPQKRTSSTSKHEISYFCGPFCPPGSGSRIRIPIHWPDWIRIQNTCYTPPSPTPTNTARICVHFTSPIPATSKQTLACLTDGRRGFGGHIQRRDSDRVQ